ncbi:MAG: iron-sulfur cluster biosynthesis family protein [Anaerolineales bacterium]
MALDDQIHENDEIFTSHDVKVIVDDRTLQYMKGATISYVEENGQSGFRINPHAQPPFASCGTGCSC